MLTKRCIVQTCHVGAGFDRTGEALNKAITERQISFAVFSVFLEGELVATLDGNGEKPNWYYTEKKFSFCGANAADCPIRHLPIETV